MSNNEAETPEEFLSPTQIRIYNQETEEIAYKRLTKEEYEKLKEIININWFRY